MKKHIFTLTLAIIIIGPSYSQKINIFARGNLGVGFNYHEASYNSILTWDQKTILFSPVGGFGIDLGIGCNIFENTNISLSYGGQQHIAFQKKKHQVEAAIKLNSLFLGEI
jgi:hypothetical protein